MNLEIGSSYKIVIQVGEEILTYSATITSCDDEFITFTDKFGREYTYNRHSIISYVKMEDNNDN